MFQYISQKKKRAQLYLRKYINIIIDIYILKFQLISLQFM